MDWLAYQRGRIFVHLLLASTKVTHDLGNDDKRKWKINAKTFMQTHPYQATPIPKKTLTATEPVTLPIELSAVSS